MVIGSVIRDFTAVINICNRPQMLARALASALRQTNDRYEIVVVDNSSDRPTQLDSAGEPKVTLVRSPCRLGFAGARLAISEARRLGVTVGPRGVTYDPFDAASAGKSPLQRMSTKHLLLQSGLPHQ